MSLVQSCPAFREILDTIVEMTKQTSGTEDGPKLGGLRSAGGTGRDDALHQIVRHRHPPGARKDEQEALPSFLLQQERDRADVCDAEQRAVQSKEQADDEPLDRRPEGRPFTFPTIGDDTKSSSNRMGYPQVTRLHDASLLITSGYSSFGGASSKKNEIDAFSNGIFTAVSSAAGGRRETAITASPLAPGK
jgi:hypothetical protein